VAESDLPVTQDPGRNEGSRRKWGEQILRAVSALRDEVFVNKKDISILSDLTKGLSVKIDRVEKDLGDKIDRVEKDLGAKGDRIEKDLGAKIDQVKNELSNKIDRVEKDLGAKGDRIEKDLGAKIDQVKNELSDKIDRVEKDLGDKIDRVEKDLGDKIDRVEKGLSGKIDQVKNELSDKIDRVEKDFGDKIDQVKFELGDKIQEIRTDQAVMRTEIGYTKKWAYWALGVGVALMFVMVKSYVDLSAQIASMAVRYDRISESISEIKEDLKSIRSNNRTKIEEIGPGNLNSRKSKDSLNLSSSEDQKQARSEIAGLRSQIDSRSPK
jgi:uncharacterized phage infection (PIP) family protein YhgE